ncbi:unnamed protein product [Cunninghamella echinulata]
MTTTSIFSEKRSRNPLQFLWTKWNNSNNQATTTNEEKYPQSMKSPLFGIPLENTIQQNNKGLCIPYTVQLCFNEIIKRGLKTEGLFRLSGATSEVIQLQLEFEQLQKQQSLTTTTTTATIADLSNYDIHTITSVVKKYLHFLPDSVIPLAYHDTFLNSNLPTLSKEKGIPLLMDLIALLPEQHRHLLYAIISLSSHIQHDAHINMMNPEALAVVLAPVCTGLEKTLQLFTSSPVAKKPMTKKNIKLYPSKNNNQHYYHQQQHQQHHHHHNQRINPYDIQQLIKKNAQWTLFWKWMIENSDAILERIDIKVDFSSTTATSTTTSTLSSTTSSSLHHTHSLLSLHSYYNHHHQHHSPSPSPPSTSHHHHVSNSSIVDISQLPFDTHHILGSSSTLLSSSDKFYTTTTTRSPSPDTTSTSINSRSLLNHRSSRAKLRSKPSNQSILASGISLCNKSSHGFLRRLASVSSLR